MSRTNYIFVDFESVRPADLDRIAGRPARLILVLGEQDKKLPIALVKQLLQNASQVSLVESGRSGKNALDLVLAHYIGEAKKVDPHGYFHIISKDRDFDALIGHLKDSGTLAARRTCLGEIPILMTSTERVALLTAHFKANSKNRPKKRSSLESMIQVVFGRSLSAAELEDTIQSLIRGNFLSLSDKGTVSYGM